LLEFRKISLHQFGEDYQRLLPELITPSSIAITRPLNRLLRPGQTATLVFQIRNLGGADVFDVSAKDLQGFVTGATPTHFNLVANQTVDVTVTVQVPHAAEPGTADPISLFVQSGASSNSAAVEAFVTTVAAQGGQPVLFGAIVAKGVVEPGVSFVDVKLTNTGSGDGRIIKIDQLQLRTLDGAGEVTYNATLAPALPRPVADLDIGDSTPVRLYLNVPDTVKKFSVTETGTVRDIGGAVYNFSVAQVVYP